MPQDPNKVKLIDASRETRGVLKIYLVTLQFRKCTFNDKPIKTLENAVRFAIQEAEKVPVLEKENSVLKRRIQELEEEIKADNEYISEMNGGN